MLQLKIPQSIYNTILADLKRPHSYAFERVGFLFTRNDTQDNKILQILATKYLPVYEDDYIPDMNVGAKINSNAIRGVMQRSLETGEGVLHVHMHDNLGIPRFSKTDLYNLPPLINSFQSISPNSAHGALLLSKDCLVSKIWLPKSKTPVFVDKITIIGYPMEVYTRC